MILQRVISKSYIFEMNAYFIKNKSTPKRDDEIDTF